jgi:hypothetical protein
LVNSFGEFFSVHLRHQKCLQKRSKTYIHGEFENGVIFAISDRIVKLELFELVRENHSQKDNNPKNHRNSQKKLAEFFFRTSFNSCNFAMRADITKITPLLNSPRNLHVF